MNKTLQITSFFLSTLFLVGCASVPMATVEQDRFRKTFKKPSSNRSGLYVYRNTIVGAAIIKSVYIDEYELGETANKVYLYKEITPGEHELSTDSEFGYYTIKFKAHGGENHFAALCLRVGTMAGGAGLKMVTQEVGQEGVLQCRLAK